MARSCDRLCLLVFLPALRTTGNFGTLWGVQAFVGGMIALLDFHPYWLANPVFWCGAIALRMSRWKVAVWCGVFALFLGTTLPILLSVESQRIQPPPGTTSVLMPGYYVWLASFAGLALVAFRVGLRNASQEGER